MSKQAFMILLVIIAMVAAYGGYLYGDLAGYARGKAEVIKTTTGNFSPSPSPINNPFEGLKLNPFK